MYYVYVAYLDGKEKYVGYGTKRRYEHVNSGTSHLRILNEYVLKHERVFDVVIWKDNITQSEAVKLEHSLIKKFGRFDLGNGTLFNTTSGKGFLQGTHSDQAKEKISRASKKRWENLTKVEYDEYIDQLKNSENSGRFKKGVFAHNKNKNGLYGKVWNLTNIDTKESYTFEARGNFYKINKELAISLKIETMKSNHIYQYGRCKGWYLTIIREERK